jgi:hypothetical protein
MIAETNSQEAVPAAPIAGKDFAIAARLNTYYRKKYGW